MDGPNGPVDARSNGLGVAGFIVSLAGWFVGGVLCPVGLVLSLFALGKRPRGFAVAGVVVGLLGTIGWVLVFVFVGVFGALTCCVGCCGSFLSPHAVTKFHMMAAAREVRSFEKHNGRPPVTLEEAAGGARD
ncbi:MAG: DUF4190 domain-containing protein, partial [Phycisphaerales bacterium]|nr:DUF4190 domain-containing protein [Phycisphaerales bacterium]